MHSLEANEGRLEETEKGLEGDRYEVVYKIVNFLWVAGRTVVVVEDGPEGEAVWTGCHISWWPKRRFTSWYLGEKSC